MRPHRGIALLLVLAALVISTTAALSLTRHATTTHLSRSSADRMRLARVLVAATEPLVLDWLESQASQAVVSPDSNIPGVSVTQDVVETALGPATIEVSAFDQLGMVPWQLAEDLRIDLGDDLPLPPQTVPLGLDQLTSAETVFPSHLSVLRPIAFEDADVDDSDSLARRPVDNSALVGARLSTHGIDVPDAATPSWSLNVNTAPIDLLEAVFSAAELDAIDPIREARSQSERTAAPVSVVEFRGTRVRLVSRSDRWAVRIDATVASVRHPVWRIYIQRGSRWTLEQSLVIAE